MGIQIHGESQTNRIQLFRELADKVSAHVEKYGVKLVPYRDPSLPHFCALSVDKQKQAVELLGLFQSTIEATEKDGDAFDDQGRSVWHALSTMKLIPHKDQFSKFGPDSLVEIYDMQGFQIWRNFNFFRFCSYTLEEIYSIEWQNRYRRDPKRTEECLQQIGALLTGQASELFCPGIVEHVLEETCSVDLLKFRAHYDWISVLKNKQGEVVAWMVVISAKIIGKGLPISRPALSLVPPEQPQPQL